VKTQAANEGAPRSLDDDKNADVETMFEKRVERFLSSHTLKFDLKGSDIMDSVSNAGRAMSDVTDYFGLTESETAEESRGKKSKFVLLFIEIERCPWLLAGAMDLQRLSRLSLSTELC